MPVCRRAGCPEPASNPRGFCIACALRYAAWRLKRDELEHHLTPFAADPASEHGLDDWADELIWTHLRRGPFA